MNSSNNFQSFDLANKMLDMIKNDEITELEAERLLNATSRLGAGVPTGTAQQSSRKAGDLESQ